MKKFWGGLVDQVAFVDYNPWENSYEKEKMTSLNLAQIYGEECSFGGMELQIRVMWIINLNYQ